MAQVALRDYLSEIDDLIEHGSIEAALQHCRHILTQYPKLVEVYRLLGKALLEQEEDRAAQDVFQRVLSVDPEDFLARVGLSIVHDRNNELEAAIWHMERAFDIAPSNALIQGELRRLYARRDGEAPARIPLSRGALARMYAQGDLNAEALVDLRELLKEQPQRFDLQIQIAEVFWRDGQRLDAAEYAQQVLETLPYCLKANLILGAILHDSEDSASVDALQRAQAVDAENDYADRLFEGQGPLTKQKIMVDYLAVRTMAEQLETPAAYAEAAETEEVPDWLRGLTGAEQPLEEETRAPLLAAGLHMPAAATEIPDWLQGLTPETPSAPEAEVPDWLVALTGVAAAGAAEKALKKPEVIEEEVLPSAEEEVPDWLSQLSAGVTLPVAEEPVPLEEERPSWLSEVEELPRPYSEAIPVEEDTQTPDWLATLTGAAVAGVAAEALTKPEEPVLEEEVLPAVAEEEVPDWLSQLSAGVTLPVVEEPVPLEEERPSWLAEVEELPRPYSEAIPVEEDTQTPDWLATLTGAAVAGVAAEALTKPEEPVLEEEVLPATEEEVPDWLAQLQAEQPALEPVAEEPESDWLAQLAASKGVIVEEGPPFAVEAEEESKAEQPGGWGLTPLSVAGLAGIVPEEEAEAEPEEIPAEAISFALPTVVAEAPAVELEAPVAKAEVPEAMPSADDALAFLAKLAAGKEDQLRAEAQAEGDTRMAEIMGRKPVPAAKPEEKPGVGAAVAGAVVAGAVVAGAAIAKKEEKPKPVEKPAPVVEPPAVAKAEVPEAMPSADDALAFLAKLAAGKEDQLRAEAQAEADTRMAEIMGRKPAPAAKPEEKPGVGAAVAGAAVAGAAIAKKGEKPKPAEKPAPVVEPPAVAKAEVPEAMPSADDALAFLAKLAAGKEDQLRAEAQAEADTRMAEIMGRKPAPAAKPEAKPGVGVAVAGAAVAGAAIAKKGEKPKPVEKPAPVVEPPVVAKAEVPEAMPSADDALAFLAKLAAGKEDQLRAEAQAEADTRMAEIMGRKPAPAAKPEEKPGVGAAVAGAAVAGAAIAKKGEKPKPAEKPAPVVEPPAVAKAEVPEAMPSADDALAFLAKLAAGKEDQLRAEAQAEADTRMAEIMGRKPAPAAKPEAKPGVGAAVAGAAVAGAAVAGAAVAGAAIAKKEEKPKPAEKPAPVVEPPAVAKAEVPEAMPSADDALAFLAKLAAGKEDQLRAEAQAEADTRMAEIMGRKPAPAAKPEEPAPEEVKKPGPFKMTVPAATVAAVAAGLSGRKIVRAPAKEPVPEAPVEVKPEEKPVTSAEAIGLVAAPEEGAEQPKAAGVELAEEEVAAPVTAEELPDWLKAMQPAADTSAEATAESELPDWLKAMQPGGVTAESGLVALFDQEEPVTPEMVTAEAEFAALFEESVESEEAAPETPVVTPEGELPDWLKSMQPAQTPAAGPVVEEIAIAAPVEVAPVVEEEEKLSALVQTSALLSLDWWVQTASDTNEEPLAELPAPYISPRAQAAAKEKAKPSAAHKEKGSARGGGLPKTGPLRQTGALNRPVIVSADVEPLLTRLKVNDHDHAARLDLARTYWATGNRDGAYEAYARLNDDGEFPRDVLSDLETIVEVNHQADWRRLLGDTYMKNGKLSSALDQYRRALSDMY